MTNDNQANMKPTYLRDSLPASASTQIAQTQAGQALSRAAEEPVKHTSDIALTVLSHLPEAVYVLDSAGRFVFANEVLLSFLGLSAEELIGTSLENAPLATMLTQDHRDALNQISETGLGVVGELSFAKTAAKGTSAKNASGASTQLSTYSYSLKPVFDATGAVELVIGQGRDISHQKTSELELAASKTLNERVLAASNIGTWVLDGAGTINYDQHCQRIWQFPSELSVEAALQRIHPEDAEYVQEQLSAVFAGATEKFSAEYRECLPDGHQRWVLVRGVAIKGQRGDLAISGLVEDIHDKKLSERKLERLSAELAQQVDMRTAELHQLGSELTLTEQRERQKLAKTLHDSVQQELFAVQFALASLRPHLGEDAADTLAHIDGLIKGAVKLTRNITTELKPPELEHPDLCLTLSWLANSLKERFGLKVTLEGEETCTVEHEPVRVLLYNLTRELLFNVVKHADTDEATVELALDGSSLELSVADKGSGFKAAHRGDGGTGLGLSGVHKRLRVFGGDLKIESEPGEGTRVSVRIPKRSLSQI